MTDYQPCLSKCSQALAEAERLIACLTDFPTELDPELAVTRARIAKLRREVERLRGMTIVAPRKKDRPDWSDLACEDSPWSGGKARVR